MGCGGVMVRRCRRRIWKVPSCCHKAIKARPFWSTTISGLSCGGIIQSTLQSQSATSRIESSACRRLRTAGVQNMNRLRATRSWRYSSASTTLALMLAQRTVWPAPARNRNTGIPEEKVFAAGRISLTRSFEISAVAGYTLPTVNPNIVFQLLC